VVPINKLIVGLVLSVFVVALIGASVLTGEKRSASPDENQSEENLDLLGLAAERADGILDQEAYEGTIETPEEREIVRLWLIQRELQAVIEERYAISPGVVLVTPEQEEAWRNFGMMLESFFARCPPDEPSSYLGGVDFQVYWGSAEPRLSTIELYYTHHPEIMDAAGDAAGNTTNPYQRTRNIWDYVHSYLTYESLGSNSALEIMRERHGTCGEYAMLCVSLCRTAGLPARLVFLPDEHHFIAQVWIEDRWAMVDPTQHWFYWESDFYRSYEYLDPNGRWVLIARTI